ncbi:MAG TPA: sugar-binding protein, partial [Dysgonamonadaceae bacterium]|nr:sugar-binding protein [Dysgonamonadaceae bacterium]
VLEPNFSKDRDVEKEDRVELFFSKDKEMSEYYCFEIDAKGRVLSYSAKYYRSFNFDWDVPTGFKVAAKINSNGYSVEGSIPLEFIKNLNPNGELFFGAYRAEFSRQGNVKIENWLTWINPKTESPDFHVPSSLGKLILNDFKRVKNKIEFN